MRINLLPSVQSTKTSFWTVISKPDPKPVIKSTDPLNSPNVNSTVNARPSEVKPEQTQFEAIPIVGKDNQVVQVKHNKSTQLTNILIYVCWVIFLLGSLVFLMGEYFDYDLAKGELISLDNQIAEYRTYLAKEKETSLKYQENQQPDLSLAFLTYLYQPWLAVFNDLASVLPENLWLTGIEGTSQGKLTVKGQSLTYDVIGTYISNLQEIPLFQTVELIEVHRVSSKIPDYSFTIEIKAGGNGLE